MHVTAKIVVIGAWRTK